MIVNKMEKNLKPAMIELKHLTKQGMEGDSKTTVTANKYKG